MANLDLALEFARVVSCTRCGPAHSKKLLRDGLENIPQPGYVGPRYAESRLLLVGQNPAECPPRFAERDAEYTRALRTLRDEPTPAHFQELGRVLERFVPDWPIHGSYFPLAECGLQLDQVAYCNAVRCRTLGNATPGRSLASECVGTHLERWMDLLRPRVVVFLGKWAHDQAAPLARSRGIPFAFINRDRSLNSTERTGNRAEVVALVRSAMETGK